MRNDWIGSDRPWRDGQDVMQATFAVAGEAGKAVEPFVKAASRVNAELVSLGSQRAQAYLGWPARLVRCRTPQDVMQEQMRFWQTAMEQYSTASRHVMAAWSSAPEAVAWTPSAASNPLMEWNRSFLGLFGLPPGQPMSTTEPRSRDYITVPQPDDGSYTGQRRAA